MKYLIIPFIFLLVTPSFSDAQRNSPAEADQVGLSISTLGRNDVVSFAKIMGGASYLGDGYYTLGISYLHPLTRILDLES